MAHDQPAEPIENYVARALAMQQIRPDKWPNEETLRQVDREWRKYLPASRVAIAAVGEFLAKSMNR